jgi:hypothetical protein
MLSFLMDAGLLTSIGFNYLEVGKNETEVYLQNTEYPTSTFHEKDDDQNLSWIGIGLFLPYFWSLIVGLSIFIGYRLYIIVVGVEGVIRLHRKYDHSQRRSDTDDTSDIDVCLEPIGLGFFQTWEFYKDVPGLGVCILLTVDLVSSSPSPID